MIPSETQRMIQEMARNFAHERLAPQAALRDEQSLFPKDEIAEMGKLGLMGMLIPEKYGGCGADYVSMALAIEEIAAADGACSTIMSVQNSLVGPALLKHGTDWQKDHFLNPLARGEMLGAFALTESQAGSDAAALRCSAVRDGEDYILNGSKQFITSGKHADIALVFAVTDKAAGKKAFQRLSCPPKPKATALLKLNTRWGKPHRIQPR